eukprot:8663191-Pyramimonas_sp.AAC.1
MLKQVLLVVLKEGPDQDPQGKVKRCHPKVTIHQKVNGKFKTTISSDHVQEVVVKSEPGQVSFAKHFQKEIVAEQGDIQSMLDRCQGTWHS